MQTEPKDIRQTIRFRPVDQERLKKLRGHYDARSPAIDHNDTVLVWSALFEACVALGLEERPALPPTPGDVP